MRKLKLLMMALALIVGGSRAWADVDFTRTFSNAAWEGNSGVQKNAFPLASGVNLAECYYTEFGTGFAMRQTVSGLPNGNYDVEIYAHAHHANIGGFDAGTMTDVNTLEINGMSKAIATVDNNGFGADEPKYYVYEGVTVSDGTMTITFNRTANGANWFTAAVKSVIFKGSSNYTNYTSLITNPSFESDGTGWNTTGSSGDNVTVEFPSTTAFLINGSKFAERYQPKGTVDVRQTIKAPVTGTYRVGVAAYARGTEITSATFFVNEEEVAISDMNRYTVNITLLKGADITFGVKATGTGGGTSWFAFDDFTLELLSVPSASTPVDLTDKIANPSFSSAYTTGWTLDGTEPNAYNSTYGTYENFHRVGGLHQSLTGLPNGVYKVTMQAAVRYDGGPTGTFNLYATTSNGTTKTPSTVAPNGDFATTASTMAGDATFARIETYAIVTDGNLTIGHYESEANTWPVFDNYTLTYYGAGSDAYALALASEAAKAKNAIDAMTTSSLKTSISSSYTTHNSDATLANIQWMTLMASSATELSDASKLSTAADAIAGVSYEETTTGSHTIYTDAISSFEPSIIGATTTDAITTAISTLKTAIKAYISNAKPSADNLYFDITCLIENPSFDNNNALGWSGDTPRFESYNNAEFFDKNFDFYQTIAGLPNGSYSLSVQAFCRPGDNGNATAGAYYDYKQGVNNITAELYVNSDASTVVNIYSYTGNTTGAKVDGNDFNCNISPDNYWVPNNMKGAGLYFADENVYKTTVAALVEDGNLKIGFREANKKTNQWVIFDNFHLYYYGSSKLIYYMQYLPQLKAEASADLANGAYANVLGGKEANDFSTALTADPTSETEEAYKTVIDAILEKQTAFHNAKASYDAWVAVKAATLPTKISANIGTDVFQYNETTNNTLYTACETAKSTAEDYSVTTATKAADVQALVDAYNTAVSDYDNQPLNAPAADKRYNVSIVDAEQAWDGNDVTFIEGGRDDAGYYAIKYLTTAKAYMNQALKFTAVEGENNTYKVSAIRVENGGEQYITTGLTYSGSANQICTTDDASKATGIKISATSTTNQFQLLNVADGNKVIARNASNPDNGMDTDGTANFTIAEASQASVGLTISSENRFATRIFPFTPELPTGVEAYSCSAHVNDLLTLTKVVTPAANTPYILYTKAGCSATLTGWGTAKQENYTVGYLTGVYESTTATADTYVMQKNDGKVGFYQVQRGEEPTIGVYRAYMTIPSSLARAFFIGFDEGETTAIKTLDVLMNEKVNIYNANGVQIPSLQKGMNIIKGSDGKARKVMVK